MTPTPNQTSIQTALRSFLLTILPPGVDVIEALDNRVPEPIDTDFVVISPTIRKRLGTNITVWGDTVIQGSISGSALTASSVSGAAIIVPSTLWGVNLPVNGVQITARNLDGTYAVSGGPFSIPSQQFAAGNVAITQPTAVTMQCDVHSEDLSDASDMAQVIATAMRDDLSVSYFLNLGMRVTPLYAEDPRLVPFINAEQQWETRWVVDVVLQANQTISAPMQFFPSASVTIVIAD